MDTDEMLERRLTSALMPVAATGDQLLVSAAARLEVSPRARPGFGWVAVAMAGLVFVWSLGVLQFPASGQKLPTVHGLPLTTELDRGVVRLKVGSPVEYVLEAPLAAQRLMVWQAVCPDTSPIAGSLILFGFAPAGAADLSLEGVGDVVRGIAAQDGTFVFVAEPLPRTGTEWNLVRHGRSVAKDWVAAYAIRLEDDPSESGSTACVLSPTDPSLPKVK